MADLKNIQGFDALERNLAGLVPELQAKVLADAVSAGAGVIQDEIRSRTPVRQDGLAKKLSKRSHFVRHLAAEVVHDFPGSAHHRL